MAQGPDTRRTIIFRAVEGHITQDNKMDHRWGPRRACRAQVNVSARGGITGSGRLRDVSLSGAFLETAASLPLFAQLAISLVSADGSAHPLDFPAVVVRQDAGGVGIEWCDPNPGSICRALGCDIDCGHAPPGAK